MDIQYGERSAGFLLGVVYRKAVGDLQHRLRDYDITAEQWSVLYFIVKEEGLIQKDLATLSHKDKPTVTRILNQLESRGLIERKADLKDRRSIRIYSSDQGKNLIGETIAIEQGVTNDIKQCLGEEQYALFIQSLGKLMDHYTLLPESDEV